VKHKCPSCGSSSLEIHASGLESHWGFALDCPICGYHASWRDTLKVALTTTLRLIEVRVDNVLPQLSFKLFDDNKVVVDRQTTGKLSVSIYGKEDLISDVTRVLSELQAFYGRQLIPGYHVQFATNQPKHVSCPICGNIDYHPISGGSVTCGRCDAYTVSARGLLHLALRLK